jgi:hypothetical protein
MGSGFLLFLPVFRYRVTQMTSLNRLTGLVLYAIEANKKRIDTRVGGRIQALGGGSWCLSLPILACIFIVT